MPGYINAQVIGTYLYVHNTDMHVFICVYTCVQMCLYMYGYLGRCACLRIGLFFLFIH